MSSDSKKMIKIVIEKCVKWNNARYNQEFSYDLSVHLLSEEIAELSIASNPIEILDAVGDITFVAIGVLWKLGFSENEIGNIFSVLNSDNIRRTPELMGGYAEIDFIKNNTNSKERLKAFWLAVHGVSTIASNYLFAMNLEPFLFEITDIICDSNNTKSLSGDKTLANVKANINKGVSYIPPTENLRIFLNKQGWAI